MTYKAVHIGQPNYLNELIQPYHPVRTVLYLSSRLLDLTLLLMFFPFLPPPSGAISLRMFDHAPITGRPARSAASRYCIYSMVQKCVFLPVTRCPDKQV